MSLQINNRINCFGPIGQVREQIAEQERRFERYRKVEAFMRRTQLELVPRKLRWMGMTVRDVWRAILGKPLD